MMISLAMERKPSQREMTSVLLSDMYGHILHLDDIAAGFDLLLENLPDLILDTPDAATVCNSLLFVTYIIYFSLIICFHVCPPETLRDFAVW